MKLFLFTAFFFFIFIFDALCDTHAASSEKPLHIISVYTPSFSDVVVDALAIYAAIKGPALSGLSDAPIFGYPLYLGILLLAFWYGGQFSRFFFLAFSSLLFKIAVDLDSLTGRSKAFSAQTNQKDPIVKAFPATPPN
jgi:hypothetical protein